MIYHGENLGNFYLVSNTGEIMNSRTGAIRKKNINHEGYYFVTISLGSRSKKLTVKNHRAVAETFILNPDNNPVINHKDGNKLNNHVSNLEFCSYKYNTQHAIENNLMSEKWSQEIVCLNTNEIFPSMLAASRWAKCSESSIREYIKSTKRKTAGKHPITKEPLTWMLYKDYITLHHNK